MSSGNKPADPAIVDLYRLAYNAGRPLSFVELVDGLPSAYQNDANRAYAKYRDEEGDDPIPDPWSRRQLRTALEWWVGKLLTGAVGSSTNKLFIAGTSDGTPARGKRHTGLLYTANRDKPPTVMEQVLVMKPTTWTPEIGATGRRHVAGIKFREKVTAIDALGSKVTKPQLEEALQLAREALSYGTRLED